MEPRLWPLKMTAKFLGRVPFPRKKQVSRIFADGFLEKGEQSLVAPKLALRVSGAGMSYGSIQGYLSGNEQSQGGMWNTGHDAGLVLPRGCGLGGKV